MRDGPGEAPRQAGRVALAAWFAVAVLGPPVAREIDRVQIAGMPAGFLYAELGAVLLLVLVLAFYALAANRGGREEDA